MREHLSRPSVGVHGAHWWGIAMAMVLACSSGGQRVSPGRSTLASPPAIVVRGHVLAHDGKPLHNARVRLGNRGDWSEVGEHGEFRLMAEPSTLARLTVRGLHHEQRQVALWVDHDGTALDVQLATYAWREPPSDLDAVVRAQAEDATSSYPLAVAEDGVFVARIPCTSAIGYQITGLAPERAVAGTAGELRHDDEAGFESVSPCREGIAEVRVTPGALPLPGKPGAVRFADSGSLAARIHAIASGMEDRMEEFMDAFQSTGNFEDFAESFVEQRGWRAQLRAEIDRTNDERERHALWIAYFSMPDSLTEHARPEDAKPARALLRDLPPTSSLWVLDSNAMFSAVTATGDPKRYADYLDTAIREHPDRDAAAMLLMTRMYRAREAGDTVAVARDVRLVKEEFEDSWLAKAVVEFDPERRIVAGRPVPDFTFSDYREPSRTESRDSLLGTVYLLDFWASWCKPCIAELPHLREATEQFSKCGFRVVAVAVDDARADVAALQATEPMPWLVSLAERGRSDEINRRFEVFGLPSSILVGTEGNAIATSDTLRGPALLEQLEKVCSAENER